jgi:hypothetical protein
MYGFWEVGCMHLSLSASMRLHAYILSHCTIALDILVTHFFNLLWRCRRLPLKEYNVNDCHGEEC